VRPGGVVAVLWQYPLAEEVPDWAPQLGEILAPLRADHPAFGTDLGTLDAHPAFEPRVERTVPFSYDTDPARYCAFVASMSFVAGLPEGERENVLRRVREVIPDGPFSVPYRTTAWLNRRRG
jgi:hypothetical protein